MHRGVSAAAETKEIDAIARLPRADDGCVSVDDAPRQAATKHLFPCLSDFARLLPRRRCTDAMQVKGDLLPRIDTGVGTVPGRPVQLVHVRAALIGKKAALVPGAVREQQDVLRQPTSLSACAGRLPRCPHAAYSAARWR
jgi:hypothetical protein